MINADKTDTFLFYSMYFSGSIVSSTLEMGRVDIKEEYLTFNWCDEDCSLRTEEIISRLFYVDDCLVSVSSEQKVFRVTD